VPFRRTGKGFVRPGITKNRSDGKFTVIIILLLLQTGMLALILAKDFGILPQKKAAETSAFVKYPAEEQFQAAPPPVITPEEETSPAEVQNPLRVEVLNGSRTAGLANRTADFLRRKGFDVRDFKNAGKTYQSTTIFVRQGSKERAKELAEVISLPEELIKIEVDTTLVDIDVTLILGRDHNRYVLPK